MHAEEEAAGVPGYEDGAVVNGDSMDRADASAVTTGNADGAGNSNSYGNGAGSDNGGNAGLLQSTYQWYPLIMLVIMFLILLLIVVVIVYVGMHMRQIRKELNDSKK